MRSEGNAPKKWRTNSWFLLHDNAPAHRSVLVKDFLTKSNVTTMEYLPYSHDLAPTGFYLFPLLKSASKGWRFFDSTQTFITPITNLTGYQRGIYWSAVKVYNKLPLHIKWLSDDPKNFVIQLKKFLYHFSFYSLKEYFQH
jgi:hypothetical protein